MVKKGKGDCENISLIFGDNNVIYLFNTGKIIGDAVLKDCLDIFEVLLLQF